MSFDRRIESATVAAGMFLFMTCQDVWPESEQFRAELRCGRSRTQIEEVARTTGRPDITIDGLGAQTAIIRRGETQLVLWFDSDALVAYQRRRYLGLTSVTAEPRVNVCSNARDVEVMVEVPLRYVGADLFVDGNGTGRITTSNATKAMFLPFGVHAIEVRKQGLPALTGTVRVGSDSGIVRLTLPTGS